MKQFVIFAILIALIMGSVSIISKSNNSYESQLEVKHINIELEDNVKKIRELEGLNNDSSRQIDELNKKNDELRKELQVKLDKQEQDRLLKESTVARAKAEQPSIDGNKREWLLASNIPIHDWHYVDSIVTRESGWNPNAVNPNGGACGLGQQLPCGKWPGQWNNPVDALNNMNKYVHNRYGGWPQAVDFWNANNWY